MRPAPSLAAFLQDPDGRYLLGRRYIVFQHSPTLLGHVSWGSPNAEDVRELLQACTIGLRPEAVRHHWLVDLRALEHVDLSTYTPFQSYVAVNAEALRHKIIRQAQLRPAGMVGAIITGFSAMSRLPYPERVFDAPDDAVAWLGVELPAGLAVVEELEAIRRGALERVPLLAQLRGQLELRGALPLRAMARHLATSPRTLQRALSEAGTTYRGELRAFQVARAKQLLVAGDGGLSDVALAVGFAGLQPFVTAFRRATGETPGTFRARHRSAH
jgi:AraC-like DNA-binding protein